MDEGGQGASRGPVELLGSLRTLAATFISVVATRVEILTVELAEERLRLAKILLWSALTVFFAGLALVFLSFLVVAVNWDGHRVAALLGVVIFHAALGAGTGLLLYRQLGRKSRLFSASLEELHKDRFALNTAPPGGAALGAAGGRR
ncbi:MAG TPA: phage holin family protein [Gammaproteobacteria bacterium]|jgi:uncharacterized membrane protein YqjE|nr:phage holin family protein [Gammaproteobacteria bacterium]